MLAFAAPGEAARRSASFGFQSRSNRRSLRLRHVGHPEHTDLPTHTPEEVNGLGLLVQVLCGRGVLDRGAELRRARNQAGASRRVGLSPTEKRRLATAHLQSSRSGSLRAARRART